MPCPESLKSADSTRSQGIGSARSGHNFNEAINTVIHGIRSALSISHARLADSQLFITIGCTIISIAEAFSPDNSSSG